MKIKYFYLALFLLSSLLPSCSNNLQETEEVTFLLPAWPPENQENRDFPKLSRWKIQVEGADISLCKFSRDSKIKLSLPKNSPVSITASPITFLDSSQSEETLFFLPAGTIYPYFAEAGLGKVCQKLTWEGGFSAELVQSIYKSHNLTGVTISHVEKFLSSFNWKKLQTCINKKTQENFYNPWKIDREKLLSDLCYGNFSSDLLKQKNQLFISCQELSELDFSKVYCAYVPENQILVEEGGVYLQKYLPEGFLYKGKFSAIITASSIKKVSVEITYLPILYTDL